MLAINADGPPDVSLKALDANETHAGEAVAAISEPVTKMPVTASNTISLEQSVHVDASEADVVVETEHGTDLHETATSSVPESSVSDTVNTSEHHDESLKQLAIVGGIMALKGLKQVVQTLILGLEQYQEHSDSDPGHT